MNKKNLNERAPTIEDVAEHVQVSVATVGRALGGYGRVSAATKERVLQAARELNYHPNTIARGMKQQRTQTIGLMVGNITNPFFSTIVRAVEDTVSRHGLNVIVCNTDEDPQKELAHAKTLFERRVDGLIVSSTIFGNASATKVAKTYYGKRIPTVFVDRAIEGVCAPAFFADNFEGAYKATHHLLALGHRRIGVIVGKRSLPTMAGRIQGYRAALSDFGLTSFEALILDSAVDVDVGVEGGYAMTQRLLQLHDRPSALMVMNNLLVVGTLKALKEVGMMIPRDLSLITWDDFELAEHLTPPLTLVDQPTYTMGSLAAEQLMKAVTQDIKLEPLKVVLKPRLIVRESTAAVGAPAEPIHKGDTQSAQMKLGRDFWR